MEKNNFNFIVFIILLILIWVVFIIALETHNNSKLENNNTGTNIKLEAVKNDTIIIDTVPLIENNPKINQDSLDRAQLIKDSIAFRKSVKIINGGYNGFNERYKIWLKARNALKNGQ